MIFVENAFKHSTATQVDDIDVAVSLQVSEEGKLIFLCKNNYARIYQSSGSAKGIGLENVRKRLDLQYHHDHEFEIEQ